MAEVVGLRERKKQRTRRQIVAAALRLFDARGYDATTVADIAEAGEVSPATFFNYFAGKEDVVFADGPAHGEAMGLALQRRKPGDTPAVVLANAVEQLLAMPVWSLDPAGDLVPVRAKLIVSVPVLRARALLEVAELQAEWTRLLVAAFADELDAVTAAALTGAVVGATFAVVGGALRDGTAGESIPDLVRRAVTVALPLAGVARTEPARGASTR